MKLPYLTDILIDDDQHIWLSTDNGLIRIVENKSQQITTANGIPSSIINCIFQDNEQNIWLGSDGKGLIKIGNENILNYLQKK